MRTLALQSGQLAFATFKTNNHSRKRLLLNYNDAYIGYQFILAHVELRCTQGAWTQGFNEIKSHIAKYFDSGLSVERYRDLPADTKSFIGRCSGLKKAASSTAYSVLARTELERIQQECEALYECAIIAPAKEAENRIYIWTLNEKYERAKPDILDEWYSYADQFPHHAYPESV